MTITTEKLKEILELHQKWLRQEEGGQRANLSYADLSYANLSYANLSYANLSSANLSSADLGWANLRSANLSRANLSYANLRSANLSRADLSYADLSDANLYGANLGWANLSNADLSYADLRDANLRNADLRYTKLPNYQICCDGDILGYKKLRDGVIATLLISAATKRTSSLVGRKCRAAKAKVIALATSDGKKVKTGYSQHCKQFVYEVGKTVKPDSYDDDIRVECTGGIHFFVTKKEAEEY